MSRLIVSNMGNACCHAVRIAPTSPACHANPVAPIGIAFHALNRGNRRMDIFEKPQDYLAFLKLLEEGRRRTGVAILAYCLMPNYWHMILLPRKTAELSDFFRWVCTTHVRRWRMHRHNNGEGHLYQGRFKSFPIQQDEHLLKVMQYVEANPLRAKLVQRAEDWPYVCSGPRPAESRVTLDQKILPRPTDWARRVNDSVPPEDSSARER